MERTKWTERSFLFNMPEGWMPNILTRLLGTHARLVECTSPLTTEQLIHKTGTAWSIQEHVGHLVDLEDLHDGRINDFILRSTVLRAADMSNARTNAAYHNKRHLGEILTQFREVRLRFVDRLEQLDDETQQFEAMHPRLQVRMRPCDMAYFTAEHDDHHLASIRALIRAQPW